LIPDLSSPQLAAASPKDQALAKMISSYWVNFAKKGNPNGKGLPEWAPFKDPDAPPHILGEVGEYPNADVLNAYNGKYQELLAKLRSSPATSAQK
jgi:carboxylesterase type B